MTINRLYLNGYAYDLKEQSERTRQLRERFAEEGYPDEHIMLKWDGQPAVLIDDAIYVQSHQFYSGLVNWLLRQPQLLTDEQYRALGGRDD